MLQMQPVNPNANALLLPIVKTLAEVTITAYALSVIFNSLLAFHSLNKPDQKIENKDVFYSLCLGSCMTKRYSDFCLNQGLLLYPVCFAKSHLNPSLLDVIACTWNCKEYL